MSKGESSSVIIKSEPSSDDVHFISDAMKVEKEILAKAKPEVELEYIKEDMEVASLMKVKQEEITIKDKIANSSNAQNDLTDNNVVFTVVDNKLSPTCLNTEISTEEKRLLCQYKTSRKQELKLHIDHLTREKAVNDAKLQCAECDCNLCEFKAAEKGTLKSNMMKHVGDKPFACVICEYKTARKIHFTNHMMIHTGEKPFACNLCEFKTVQKGTLKQHIMKHTGEKPFACNLCEFKAIQKQHLKQHIMKHTGEKPFACDLCEFKTIKKHHLKEHMKKHIRQKAFACTAWELKITRSSDLKVYKRKHTSEKPLVCNASKNGFKYHNIRTHTDEKQRDSNLCEFKEDESLMEVKQEEVKKMPKEESSSVIIKNEPSSDGVHYINDTIKVEKEVLAEAKPEVDLELIKEDMKEAFFIEVKRKEITIKYEITSSSNTQNDLTDDNVEFIV